VTAGALATNATLPVGPQPNITGIGIQARDLNMNNRAILKAPSIESEQDMTFSLTGFGERKMVLKSLGNHELTGPLRVFGDFFCNAIFALSPPNITLEKNASKIQDVSPSTPTAVTWPNQVSGTVTNRITVDGLKTRFTVQDNGTYLVSWTISWPGSDGPVEVDTWVFKNNAGRKIGHQRTQYNSTRGTIQTVTATVPAVNGDEITIHVEHNAALALNIPGGIGGDNINQVFIYKLP
jgi:hypothetical protein